MAFKFRVKFQDGKGFAGTLSTDSGAEAIVKMTEALKAKYPVQRLHEITELSVRVVVTKDTFRETEAPAPKAESGNGAPANASGNASIADRQAATRPAKGKK